MAKKKPLPLFLWAIFILAFLIGMPPILKASFSGEDPAEIKTELPEWTGVIRLVHVRDWQGGVSLENFLKEQITRFEKNNPKVFIEMTVVTGENFSEELLQNADLLSFSTGTLKDPREKLWPLSGASGLKNEFAGLGTYQGTQYGIPYAYGTYILCRNTSLASTLPEDGESFANSLAGLSVDRGKGNDQQRVAGIALGSGGLRTPYLALVLAGGGGPEILEGADGTLLSLTDAYSTFAKGNSAYYVGTLNDGARLRKKAEDGELSLALSLPVGDGPCYTDMVQYMGVVRGDDAKRSEMCAKFVGQVVDERAQKGITAAGAFPVRALGESVYEPESWLYPLEGQNLKILSPFMDPKEKEEFVQAAVKALQGDVNDLTRWLP